MIDWIRLLISILLMAAGLIVCGIGVYGVFKFKYAANRMHAAAMNDTMGVSLCLLSVAVSAPDLFTALKLLLVIAFMWISAPVASHLLCRLEIETNENRADYMEIVEEPLVSGYEKSEDQTNPTEYFAAEAKEKEEVQ